jgi:glycosyltransferase involved in cell wall biosynthesis
MSSDPFNVWLSPISTRTGYGQFATEVYKSMIFRWKRTVVPLNPSVYIQDNDDTEEWMKLWMTNNMSSSKIQPYDKCLSINYPSQLASLTTQSSICFSMWESENVPQYLVNCINRQDHLIVPTEQNIHAFRNSGVVIPIYKVHLGLDSNKFKYQSRNWSISERNPFTFLHIGLTNWRKGGDLAMKAFKAVFPESQKDVRLIMKVSKQYTPPWMIPGMKASDPRIHFVKEEITDQQMLNLYGMAHCYLGCSRGDAWNLLAFQALSTGCPAICTTYCGPEEYKHLTYPLSWSYQHCSEKIFGDDWGMYGEPNFDHLCELMLHAYNNRDECEKNGREASKEISEKYTWDNTAKQILDIIDNI